MSFGVIQTRRFARQYKKLHDNVAADVDAAVGIVAGNPAICERKKGDLASLFVHKFHSRRQLYLLGYTLDDQLRLVYLEAVGPHENFYRDVKRGSRLTRCFRRRGAVPRAFRSQRLQTRGR